MSRNVASASAVESYAALALQMRCHAVNECSTPGKARSRIRDNIERTGDLIRGSKRFVGTYSGDAVRLAVLPEYFLSGFPQGESAAEWAERACLQPDGAEYRLLGNIARDNDVWLSGNAYETDSHFPDLYFQSSFIIDPAGECKLRYRRLISMYSPTPHDVLDRYLDIYGEKALFPVIDTELGRLACVASEEILFPEICRALALNGAEVICHSSSEMGSPRATPKNTAKRARAFENVAYVVSANSGGISGIRFQGPGAGRSRSRRLNVRLRGGRHRSVATKAPQTVDEQYAGAPAAGTVPERLHRPGHLPAQHAAGG